LIFRSAFSANETFIKLIDGAKRLAARAHQRAAQLVQPRPCCLVRTEPHDPLQILRGDAVTMHADLKNCAEPNLEGLARPGQQRS